MRQFLGPVAGALLALTLISACGGANRANKPATGADAKGADQKPVVVLQGVDASTLDPAGHTETPAYNILNNIYEPLIYLNNDMKLEPGLALDWKALNDTTWELHLRKDVKFHNGEPFAADDVKASLDRIVDPNEKSPRRNNLSAIKDVKVVDPYTVQIVTSAPYPVLPNRLSQEHIISAKYLKDKGKAFLGKNPMGTGPYKFVNWVKDEQAVLEANPSYWRGPVKIKQVIFKPVGEATSRIAQLQSGQADIIVNVPANQVAALENGQTTRIATVPSVRVVYVAVQAQKGGIVANPKFRQALAHAIDMESIVKNVLLGNGYPMATSLTPKHFGFDGSIKLYTYDPDLAKKLLTESGYNGEEIAFDTPSGRYAMDKEIAEAITGQLKQVGVKVRLQANEWGNHLKLVYAKEQKGLYILGWGNGTWDADGTLTPILTADGANSTYGNAETDALIQQARSIMDPKQRDTLYHQALAKLYESAAHIADWEQKDVYAISKRINWNPRPDENINLFDASLNG